MIQKSAFFKLTSAVVLSIGVHFSIVAALGLSKEPALIEGGAPAEIALLGNSFEDLVAAGDDLEPVDPEKITETEAPDPSESLKPDTIEATQSVVKPDIIRPHQATIEKVQPVRRVEPLQAASIIPEQNTPTPVETASKTPPPEKTEEVKPQEALAPVTHDAPAIKPLPEKVSQPKPKEVHKKKPLKKKADKKHVVKKKTAGRKQAKATVTKNKGRIDGDAKAKSAEKGKKSAKRSRKIGNAAVSNYPGKVQRRISRLRPQRVKGKGTARVRFVISANGQLSTLSIAKSSGSSEVDQAALNLVRRAAPFPKPPVGARRSFIVPIRVKS